jgi:hypothetical protein
MHARDMAGACVWYLTISSLRRELCVRIGICTCVCKLRLGARTEHSTGGNGTLESFSLTGSVVRLLVPPVCLSRGGVVVYVADAGPAGCRESYRG